MLNNFPEVTCEKHGNWNENPGIPIAEHIHWIKVLEFRFYSALNIFEMVFVLPHYLFPPSLPSPPTSPSLSIIDSVENQHAVGTKIYGEE